MSKRLALPFIFSVISGLCIAAGAQQIQVVLDHEQPAIAVPKAGVSLDLTAIDKTADPCQDFYVYACGNWRKDNSIPADRARWGRFDELAEHNRYTLYTLLEQAAKAPRTPLQVKYGNYYAACMNQPLADRLGSKPIQPTLARIEHWHEKSQLANLVAELEDEDGIGSFYGFGSEQDQKDSLKQIAVLAQGGYLCRTATTTCSRTTGRRPSVRNISGMSAKNVHAPG